MKVAPVPKHGRVQIVPPFHAYGGHRGMRRILVDLKQDTGRGAFLRLAAGADVLIESFRPGVVGSLGIDFDAVRAVNPGIVYCSTSGYGQNGPHATRAGHDLNYLAIGGFLATTHARADGGPPVPGATVADSAGGGMHAVIAILAALVRRGATGTGAYLDVAAADGVLALMSLAVDEYLATGAVPQPRHGLLTGRYACYDNYEAADGGWLTVAAIEPHFWANLCRLVGCEQWIPHQMDDAVQDEIRADLRAAFKTRTRDEWTEMLAPADTCVAPVLSVPEVVDDAQYAARQRLRRRRARNRGSLPPGRTRARRTGAPDKCVRAARRDRDRRRRAPRRCRVRGGGDRAVARRRSRRVTDLPDDVHKLIDQPQYEIDGEFPVEQGYIWTSCASVENGNPLFWDGAAADEITKRTDRAADDGVGVVPSAPLAAGTQRTASPPAGALRLEGTLRAARSRDDGQHVGLPRAGAGG